MGIAMEKNKSLQEIKPKNLKHSFKRSGCKLGGTWNLREFTQGSQKIPEQQTRKERILECTKEIQLLEKQKKIIKSCKSCLSYFRCFVS